MFAIDLKVKWIKRSRWPEPGVKMADSDIAPRSQDIDFWSCGAAAGDRGYFTWVKALTLDSSFPVWTPGQKKFLLIGNTERPPQTEFHLSNMFGSWEIKSQRLAYHLYGIYFLNLLPLYLKNQTCLEDEVWFVGVFWHSQSVKMFWTGIQTGKHLSRVNPFFQVNYIIPRPVWKWQTLMLHRSLDIDFWSCQAPARDRGYFTWEKALTLYSSFPVINPGLKISTDWECRKTAINLISTFKHIWKASI